MRALSKLKTRGFTLIELMIVVAIVGVLAALAIYGVRRYLLNAKTAEARNALGQLGKDAKAAFDRETMAGTILAAGGSIAGANALCDSTGNSVPSTTANISGKKYQSAASEWTTGNQSVGWRCLRFAISDPQYYTYNYTAANPAASNATFAATAVGDLDGNGTTSSFTLNGANTSGVIFISPNFVEVNAEE